MERRGGRSVKRNRYSKITFLNSLYNGAVLPQYRMIDVYLIVYDSPLRDVHGNGRSEPSAYLAARRKLRGVEGGG